jgi:hypothetical protein
VNAQEGVAGVVVAVEVVLDLGLLDRFLQFGYFLLEFGLQPGVLVDQFDVGVDLFDGGAQFVVDLDDAVEDLFFFGQPG